MVNMNSNDVLIITAAVDGFVVAARRPGPHDLSGLFAQPQRPFLGSLLQVKPSDDRASLQDVQDAVELRGGRGGHFFPKRTPVR